MSIIAYIRLSIDSISLAIRSLLIFYYTFFIVALSLLKASFIQSILERSRRSLATSSFSTFNRYLIRFRLGE